MDKIYLHGEVEKKWTKLWEESGFFTPKTDPQKKPFSIIMPPPNANDPLHMGHALYVVEDILCRWHRMTGDPTLFLPGTDHAGIETQYVFEKELAKKGKSRFDFDRETLYRMINEFVERNRGIVKEQMRRLGFSLDWSREKYTLDKNVLKIVFETFKKLHQDGLVYRGERLVNYCPKCGTGFSDLEIKYREQIDPLYYMKYGPFVLATVRPETKFGDTAVAVNPKDKRYKKWIGKEIRVEGLLGKLKMNVIGDDAIDPKFGTGVAKVTPAHDHTDFEIGKRHNLEMKQVIGFDGRLTNIAGPYAGLKVKAAREQVARDLQKKGLIDHIDTNYMHSVATCYKCGTVLEPLPIPQWYVKTKPLAKLAIKAVKEGKTKIVPLKRFEKMYFEWLEKIEDWNISRQIVWGPRIPVWYCLECNENILIDFIDKNKKRVSGGYQELKEKYDFREIKRGLQKLTASKDALYSLENKPCKKCTSQKILQETDTFDTWFSSGQWPLTTLGFPQSRDFKYFYPFSVLDTMWDILFFWVARMVMLGLYRTKQVPFRVAHMHCRVVDRRGQKMSKSRGNVIDPMEMVEKYGADALRMALIFGASPGSDICLGEDKVRAMRNFANKIWNIGRFILTALEKIKKEVPFYSKEMDKILTKEDEKIVKNLDQLIKKTTGFLEKYRFDLAAESLYHFIWHRFADKYIEYSKERIKKEDVIVLAVLRHVYLNCLKLLHPFMPFVTEEIWERMPKKTKNPLIISPWPKPPATPDFFPHIFRIISAVVLVSVLISNFIFLTFSPSSSFDKAKQEILKEPNKPGGYLKLADEFLKVNNFEEAKKELLTGLSFSFDSFLKKKIGEVEEEIQKPSEIRNEILEWEKIVSEKPDYRDGFLRLALLYYRIFAKEKARENLNKALAVDPNFKPAREIEKRFFSD